MLLQTLGELTLSNNGKEIEIGKNELIILAHLLIDGPQTREQLANKIWHGKRFELAQDGNSLAQKNLRSALSRLRIGLRKGTKKDILEVSDRSTTLSLGKHNIRCDYLELLELLEQPTSETNQLVKSSLNLEFMARIEFSNRLDIRGDLEHPLFQWVQTKRDGLKHKVDEVFSGQRLAATVQTHSIQELLNQEPSSAELNNLYAFCDSSDYPFDERQKRKDLASILTYFSSLYNIDDEETTPVSVFVLAMIALTNNKLKPIYLEDAIGKYNESQKEELDYYPELLEELQDDGWITEDKTLVLKREIIVKGWLEQNPRVAATLLKTLLQVTPADERELLSELYAAPVEMLEQLGKEDTDLLLLAAQENLGRELFERAAKLLNYGLKGIFTEPQKDYARLLLAYAYERAGHYEQALKSLEKLPASAINIPVKRQDRLPSSAKDVIILKQYILLKMGMLPRDEIRGLEAQPEPLDLSWSEAKRFNLLGIYYLHNVTDTSEQSQRFEKAIRYFNFAQEIWENLNSKNNVLSELNNIAVAYAMLGEFNQAVEKFEYAIKRAQKAEVSTLAYLRTLFSFATAHQNKSNYEDALRLFAECYKVPGVKDHQGFLMRVSFNQGLIHDLSLDKKNEAEKYYELTRDIATSLGDMSMRGRAIASIGLLKKQKFLVDSGINILRQSGDTSDLDDYVQEREMIWPTAS